MCFLILGKLGSVEWTRLWNTGKKLVVFLVEHKEWELADILVGKDKDTAASFHQWERPQPPPSSPSPCGIYFGHLILLLFNSTCICHMLILLASNQPILSFRSRLLTVLFKLPMALLLFPLTCQLLRDTQVPPTIIVDCLVLILVLITVF